MKKKVFTILLIIVSSYVVIQVMPYRNSTPKNRFIVEENEPPLVIAHGGAKKMNPENTWMAFEYAIDLGVDVIEMDVRLTKDNQLITYHNEKLEDFSNASGYPIDYTYEELSTYNFGLNFTDLDGNKPYANLSEEEIQSYNGSLSCANVELIFQLYGKNTMYIIEIKDGQDTGIKAAERLMELVKEYDMYEYVCLASFNQEVIDYIASKNIEGLIYSLDFDTAVGFVVANYAGYGAFIEYSHYGLQLPPNKYNIPLNTSYLIYKAHKQGMFVHYWTIDDEETMISCINNKADGIMSDWPDILIKVLEDLGY